MISFILPREQKEAKEGERNSFVSKKKKFNDEKQKEVLSTSSEQLFDQTQSLVAEINAKRKNDSVLLAGKMQRLFRLFHKC